MPKSKELDPLIVKFIEENIDLEPQELMAEIKDKFGTKCQTADCFCQTIQLIKQLYCNCGRTELPVSIHERLMDCLRKA